MKKIEKHVEAIKVKVTENIAWVKKNRREAFKRTVKGLSFVVSAVLAGIGLKQNITLKKENSDLSDAVEYFQNKEIASLENQRAAERAVSDGLRHGSSECGKYMNSLRNSSSDEM